MFQWFKFYGAIISVLRERLDYKILTLIYQQFLHRGIPSLVAIVAAYITSLRLKARHLRSIHCLTL
jgi:hypothetical protein